MAHYYFDGASHDAHVKDLYGCEIQYREELRPAMIQAMHGIRAFLGDEHQSKDWSLEIRLGENNRLARFAFREIEVFERAHMADEPVLSVAA